MFLGAVQGLTEFLPVSSTGHLILVRHFFGTTLADTLTYDVFLHLATAFAVLIYFRKDIAKLFLSIIQMVKGNKVSDKDRYLVIAISLGIIPAVVLGLSFDNFIENSFRNPLLVALALIAGSILFWYAEKVSFGTGTITPKKGFIIGFFQALALIPGISRSGSTISGGLISNLSREEAVRFSFLLGFPIILGAGVYKILKFSDVLFSNGAIIASLAGFIAALISGLYAIHFLVRFLKNHSLLPFIVYRIVLAGLVIVSTVL